MELNLDVHQLTCSKQGDGVCDIQHWLGIDAQHMSYPYSTSEQDMGTKFGIQQLTGASAQEGDNTQDGDSAQDGDGAEGTGSMFGDFDGFKKLEKDFDF